MRRRSDDRFSGVTPPPLLTLQLLFLFLVCLVASSAGAASTGAQTPAYTTPASGFFDSLPGMNLFKNLMGPLNSALDRTFEYSLFNINENLVSIADRLIGARDGDGEPPCELVGPQTGGANRQQCNSTTSSQNNNNNGAPRDPDATRNVSQIIRSRGFRAEEHDVVTKDGYILTVQRIINPLVDPANRRHLKPVILQHGLMSSSVDWVINSVDIRPRKPPTIAQAKSRERRTRRDLMALGGNKMTMKQNFRHEHGTRNDNTVEGHKFNKLHKLEQHLPHFHMRDTQEQPNSLGFYLANEGYDVWLANSRGNKYGQRHTSMSSWSPRFWDFTFDEQIKYDLPDTIEYIQRLTNITKVGYVGHSQGTTMIFGLLADRPEYADIIEPVVALAPVAFVGHCLSPVKYFAIYTPIFQHINMWFGSSNVAVRYLAPMVCGPEVIRKDICANIVFLSTGFDESEFNETRVSAYLAHMPSGTSVKNIAHWGQEVLSGRFAHFDHGLLGNQARYKQASAPDYDLSKIRSKSLALFTADNDWLASPKDVARLKSKLSVPLFKWVNVTEVMPRWNHIDFLYGKDCGRFVNTKIIEIFHHFDNNEKPQDSNSNNNNNDDDDDDDYLDENI